MSSTGASPNSTLPNEVRIAQQDDSLPPRVDGRIPSLDGLRAIAVAIVFLSHLSGGPYALPLIGHGTIAFPVPSGRLGVAIFFVLSGFLITTLLLQEERKTGRVNLKAFYARRALRILPASYTYLLAVSLATAAGIMFVPRSSIVAGFLYFRNYIGSDWDTAHLWSLSVEEQFYLLWPFAFLILNRRSRVIAAFLCLPLALVFFLFRPDTAFEVNMDSMACGCLLACLWGQLARIQIWQRILRSPLFWLVPFALWALNLPLVPHRWWAMGGKALSNLLIVAGVERFIRYHKNFAARLLNSKALVTVGTLSYSLYLWQQPWLANEVARSSLQAFPVNVVLAVTCGIVSYRFVERPFLKLKARFRTV